MSSDDWPIDKFLGSAWTRALGWLAFRRLEGGAPLQTSCALKCKYILPFMHGFAINMIFPMSGATMSIFSTDYWHCLASICQCEDASLPGGLRTSRDGCKGCSQPLPEILILKMVSSIGLFVLCELARTIEQRRFRVNFTCRPSFVSSDSWRVLDTSKRSQMIQRDAGSIGNHDSD